MLATADASSTADVATCAACDEKITELYYLVAVGKAWHFECLRCVACRESLNEGSCFWKSGAIYCRDDYQRLFCRCAACGKRINATDMILRVVDDLLYHTECFQCALCQRQLERGARFFTQGNRVYCDIHFDLCTSSSPVILSNSISGGEDEVSSGKTNSKKSSKSNKKSPPILLPLSASSPNKTDRAMFKSETPPLLAQQQQQRVHMHTHQGLLSTVPAHHLATLPPLAGGSAGADFLPEAAPPGVADYFGSTEVTDSKTNGNSNSSNSQQQRGKRVRTSFKHTQLKLMKNFFQENHNPDAKDLKQLASKTGLSKRVLQVWFQNARAKYRRTLMKEQQKQGVTHVGLLPGNPFMTGNSLSDRAQSTSLLEGDSPLSQNSGGGGVHDMMSSRFDDEMMNDDDLDDGFQEEDEGDCELESPQNTVKSPSHLIHPHLQAGHTQQLQISSTTSSLTMTPPGSNYLFMETNNAAYSTPPGVEYGQIIQQQML